MSTIGSEIFRRDLVLAQVADLFSQVIEGSLERMESGFVITRRPESKGIVYATGRVDGDTISVRLELARTPADILVPASFIFRQLSSLDLTSLLPPKHGEDSLWMQLRIKNSPLSIARANVLLTELEKINGIAEALQNEVTDVDEGSLSELYKKLVGKLEPIRPSGMKENGSDLGWRNWTEDVADVLQSGLSIALMANHQISIDFALASLAAEIQRQGGSLALLVPSQIPAKDIPTLAAEAPGKIVVPAVRISMGTNLYEVGHDARAMLSALSEAGLSVIFSGDHQVLQSIFHGGQGGTNDPLMPVVMHAPEARPEDLARFALSAAEKKGRRISSSARNQIAEEVMKSLRGLDPEAMLRLTPLVSRRTIEWRASKAGKPRSTAGFVSRICSLTETVAGFSPGSKVMDRSAGVQDRFTRVLTDPCLLPFLRENILGQDEALEQVVGRLATECLTRPTWQPLRICLQGTPATGKSECTALIARKLGVPLVNIDAASIPDHYTAAAQLLGSGRGIVGSFQSGRLEQAAKHHTGVVMEVSDLDHASPAARSTMADLFLQVLETGCAQSAIGHVFSAASIIFFFTVNLPGGVDERLGRGMGFGDGPSKSDLRRRVAAELKDMLSGAFLSRVGTPILFAALEKESLGRILEKAILEAVSTAAARLSCAACEVQVENGIGLKLLGLVDSSTVSFGARLLLEHGRLMAARAFLSMVRETRRETWTRLLVRVNQNGLLEIEPF